MMTSGMHPRPFEGQHLVSISFEVFKQIFYSNGVKVNIFLNVFGNVKIVLSNILIFFFKFIVILVDFENLSLVKNCKN